MTQEMIRSAKLAPQSYGIACAQNTFGSPRGIWLECKGCPRSEVIQGSGREEWWAVSDAEVASVFRRHGWTGEGDRMLRAKCPSCSNLRSPGHD